MEREVPGKTAESVWHSPIQMACGKLISSTSLVLGSWRAAQASMTHMTTPPISIAQAITPRLPRCLSLHLCSSSEGTDVTANAMNVSEMG